VPQQSGVIESSTLTQILTPSCLYLKGHGNEADFLGLCRKWFFISPLHYLSGRSDFGFEFTEISIFEKWLPAITAPGSRRLSVSVIRGVANSPYRVSWRQFRDNEAWTQQGQESPLMNKKGLKNLMSHICNLFWLLLPPPPQVRSGCVVNKIILICFLGKKM
jgi:hypothetical protein